MDRPPSPVLASPLDVQNALLRAKHLRRLVIAKLARDELAILAAQYNLGVIDRATRKLTDEEFNEWRIEMLNTLAHARKIQKRFFIPRSKRVQAKALIKTIQANLDALKEERAEQESGVSQ